ncbi:thioredoxin family protein [Noviherbaspirillum galbum]|uniref:Thioredoxin fold domain-containing protein n=1 Tax=Noviherbaspirillum galbum TaxID=2709383 RepID=A0A6B3SSF3_9BURK|nr:thioredoxin fold domain-containing protein [Noviherbaspirillum galbum]
MLAIISPLASVAQAAASASTSGPTSAPGQHAGIAWHQGDVDSAFAEAKAASKPVFLYWGAVWCPPCNQVKATIFNRQSFIERSRAFVPVYLDGDSPDGQKLGARFKVRGYPTMILFRPDGTEITRLPGEVDADRYMHVLKLSMNATRPVRELLQAALSGSSRLGAQDWRLLADYSWDTDEQQLVQKKELAATLQRLAAACPAGENARRLTLKAIVAAAMDSQEKDGKETREGVKNEASRQAELRKVNQILADAKAARANMDLLANYATQVVEYLTAPGSAQRRQLADAWGKDMQRLAADAGLSRADRLTALVAQVQLARIDDKKGPVDPALLNAVRRQVAEMDKATTDAYERQAVISAAADAYTEAGLLDESDALLKAELKRSHSPYYFMLGLAANAKKRGDKAAALDWYDQAYKAAKGPATRLQWGVAYLNGLLDLAPNDESRIEATAGTLFTELAATPNAFYERNRASLEKLGKKLAKWNGGNGHGASLQRMTAQLAGICDKLPGNDGQKAACDGIMQTTQARS